MIKESHVSKIVGHFKERIATARAKLGADRSNEILAFLAELGPSSMRNKAEALELAVAGRYKRDVSQRIADTVTRAENRFQSASPAAVGRSSARARHGIFEIREENRMAAEARKTRTDLTMARSEWLKLSPRDKGKFHMMGGKIVSDLGNLTR